MIAQAEEMDDETLRSETRSVYQSLLKQLGETSAPHPVRAWNAIPSITRAQSPGSDRYMAFNAGRHEAYQHAIDDPVSIERSIPTASAIGHGGEDLAISILGHHQTGRAIENPRQTPATRYSSRYGPTPPSFVRATALPTKSQAEQVLVAGTASVVGEDSCHPDDLDQQLDETYRNLATVLASARGNEVNNQPGKGDHQLLQCYHNARVYIRHQYDFERVAESVRSAMSGLSEIEYVHADICRPELLVEIEGVALCQTGANDK